MTEMLATKRVEGTLYRLFEPRKAGRYKITDFIVKTQDGKDLRCSTFKAVDSQLLGKTVSFDASINSYQGKESFTVNKDSELVPLLSGATPAQNAPAEVAVASQVTVSDGSARRRGRPRRNETSSEVATSSPAQSTVAVPIPPNPVVADLEGVRSAAEDIMRRDVTFLSTLVPAEHIGAALQAFQAIRATVFIESNKRNSGRY